MVYSVERKERAVRGSGSHYDVDDREEEDGGGAFVMERSKPPLHNFNFPFLKWGNQRHLRCMKAPDSTTAAENAGGGKYGDGRFSIVSDVAADRHRRNRSPPPSRFGGGAGNYDVRRFRQPRFGGGGEEGIEAVREKLMLDLKAQADKMKNQILRRNQVSDDDDDDSDEEEEEHEDEGDKNQERKFQSRPQSQSPIPAPPVAAAPAAADKSQEEARPWNLRTRRAACKAPTLFGGNSAANAKGLRIEEKKGSSSNNNNNSSPLRSDGAKSPRLRGEKREREEKEKEKERPKFSVGLSKKEIEEDFMQMLGHRPARRPKKRPRAVQRQLDTLFPGLWLTEVTADAYKVPEIPETGKR